MMEKENLAPAGEYLYVEVADLTDYTASRIGHRENTTLLRSSRLKDFAFSAHSILTLLGGHVGLTVSSLDDYRNTQNLTVSLNK